MIEQKNETQGLMILMNNKTKTFAPFGWLSEAIKDFMQMPIISFFYGVCFFAAAKVVMWLIQWQGTHLIILPSLVVFVLIGPFLALGLYYASKNRSEGKNFNLIDSMKSVQINMQSQLLFAVFLCIAMIAWLRVATLIHALYPIVESDSIEAYLPFLTVGTIAGMAMMTIVFAMSAFSIPLMLDKKIDTVSAILTSMNAFKENFKTMTVWGLIIGFFVGIGFYTQGYGMILLMPLLGYATWHSYKETIHG